MKHPWKYYLIMLMIIFLDQALKIYAHYAIYIEKGEEIKLLGNLLKLTYTLNPGMAFGITLGFKYGKLVLTTTRIIASGLILHHIVHHIRNKCTSSSWIWGWIFVLGGAIGNSIDSVCYGIFFNNAPHNSPIKWGYGQVIDMIHVDIWEGILPKWVPFWGGHSVYCLPVFNLADVAIFLGLLIVLIIKEPHPPVADTNNNGEVT